jgi:hypothetical protein
LIRYRYYQPDLPVENDGGARVCTFCVSRFSVFPAPNRAPGFLRFAFYVLAFSQHPTGRQGLYVLRFSAFPTPSWTPGFTRFAFYVLPFRIPQRPTGRQGLYVLRYGFSVFPAPNWTPGFIRFAFYVLALSQHPAGRQGSHVLAFSRHPAGRQA